MKKLISGILALIMMISMFVIPVFAGEQEEAYNECECCSHHHVQLVKENESQIRVDCDHHNWPYSSIYRIVRRGCRLYPRYYKVCSNCGEEYGWYPAGDPIVSHLGPYSYVPAGYDPEGNILYRKKCNACGDLL